MLLPGEVHTLLLLPKIYTDWLYDLCSFILDIYTICSPGTTQKAHTGTVTQAVVELEILQTFYMLPGITMFLM